MVTKIKHTELNTIKQDVRNKTRTLIIEPNVELVVKCIYGNLQVAEIANVIFDCLDLLSLMNNVITAHFNVRMQQLIVWLVYLGTRNVGSRMLGGNCVKPCYFYSVMTLLQLNECKFLL